MNLKKEINRIKNLIYENYIPEEFIIKGDINEGVNILLKKENNEIGHSNLINFKKAWHLDSDVFKLHNDYKNNCRSGLEENFFDNNNSLFLFDLKVYENFRGNGYGDMILEKSHELCKNFNAPYCLLITNTDNNIAQNLYKKHNYKTHLANKDRIFFYKEI